MKTSTCITFLLLGALHHSNAFVSPSVPKRSFSMESAGSRVQPGSSPAMLSMLPNNFDFGLDFFDSDFFDLDLDFSSDWASQLSSFGQDHFSWMQKVQDPTVEVEVLHDFAHVILDFSGILFQPPKELMRLLPVIGRLSVMLADYIPDHSINPTEFVIQLFFLSLASKDLVRVLRLRGAIAQSRKEEEGEVVVL